MGVPTSYVSLRSFCCFEPFFSENFCKSSYMERFWDKPTQKRKTDIGKKRMPVFLTSDFEQARLFLQRCIGRGKRSLVIRFRPDFGNKFYVTNRIRFIHDEDRSRGKSFEWAVRDMSAVRF